MIPDQHSYLLWDAYWTLFPSRKVVIMIRGLLSVLLVLVAVAVSSSLAKPEKNIAKRGKRIPQTLSRGNTLPLLFPKRITVYSVVNEWIHEYTFSFSSFSKLCKISVVGDNLYLNVLWCCTETVALTLFFLTVSYRLGWSTNLGSDLWGGSVLGQGTVSEQTFMATYEMAPYFLWSSK